MSKSSQAEEFQNFSSGQHTIAQLKELQVNRRQSLLETQRQKRDEEWSYLRDLKKIVPHIDITRESVDDHFRWEFSKNLMMSEWMMEEPEDLEDFILVPCPKGIRATLIFEEQPREQQYQDYDDYGYGNYGNYGNHRNRGNHGRGRGNYAYNNRRRQNEPPKSRTAKVFAKTGHKLFEVKTNIPEDTILDVIWVKKNKTIYILDCMKYDGRDMTNSDTAFRRFWIGSKFFESRLGVIDVKMPNSNLKLNFLEGYDFKMPHHIHHTFQKMPCFEDLGAELDGYLFYHKDGSYTPGESPLVLWLFPFMVDEVLTMFRVHPDYNSFKPDGYTNYVEYIERFNSKKNEKNQKRFKNKRKKLEKDEPSTSNEKINNEKEKKIEEVKKDEK